MRLAGGAPDRRSRDDAAHRVRDDVDRNAFRGEVVVNVIGQRGTRIDPRNRFFIYRVVAVIVQIDVAARAVVVPREINEFAGKALLAQIARQRLPIIRAVDGVSDINRRELTIGPSRVESARTEAMPNRVTLPRLWVVAWAGSTATLALTPTIVIKPKVLKRRRKFRSHILGRVVTDRWGRSHRDPLLKPPFRSSKASRSDIRAVAGWIILMTVPHPLIGYWHAEAILSVVCPRCVRSLGWYWRPASARE